MIGIVDVIYSEAAPLPLCAGLQYLTLGATLAAKTSSSATFLAVDQFVGGGLPTSTSCHRAQLEKHDGCSSMVLPAAHVSLLLRGLPVRSEDKS